MENNQSNEIAIVPINWEVADEKTLGIDDQPGNEEPAEEDRSQ